MFYINQETSSFPFWFFFTGNCDHWKFVTFLTFITVQTELEEEFFSIFIDVTWYIFKKSPDMKLSNKFYEELGIAKKYALKHKADL